MLLRQIGTADNLRPIPRKHLVAGQLLFFVWIIRIRPRIRERLIVTVSDAVQPEHISSRLLEFQFKEERVRDGNPPLRQTGSVSASRWSSDLAHPEVEPSAVRSTVEKIKIMLSHKIRRIIQRARRRRTFVIIIVNEQSRLHR